MTELSEDFLSVAAEAGSLAERETDLDEGALSALESAAGEVGKSWSGSSLGYQANAYYEGFQVPPPGHIFSREWGFLGRFHGTVGDWKLCDSDEVVAYVERSAGNPDLGPSRVMSDAVRGPVAALIERARSTAALVKTPHDDYLRENLEELQRVSMPSLDRLAESLMNVIRGQFAVRDMQAAEGGWQVAGHQRVIADVMYVRSPYKAAVAGRGFRQAWSAP